MGASGVANADFGAFPGQASVTVDVTGQAGLVAASEVEAWVIPVATAEHTADEHLVEAIDVAAAYLADGQMRITASVRVDFPQAKTINAIKPADEQVQRHRLYGNWSLGWAWN